MMPNTNKLIMVHRRNALKSKKTMGSAINAVELPMLSPTLALGARAVFTCCETRSGHTGLENMQKLW